MYVCNIQHNIPPTELDLEHTWSNAFHLILYSVYRKMERIDQALIEIDSMQYHMYVYM